MSKFKVGDKVRYDNCNTIYTVEGIKVANGSPLIQLTYEGNTNWYIDTYYSLVEEPKTNPLVETVTRTVTRTIKEKVTEQVLKSGNYGQIYIAGDETVYHCNINSGKMNQVTTDRFDETIDALIAIRDHWRAVGKIK